MHENLSDFLDKAIVGIHFVDKEGIILYANEAELNLLGVTEEEYIGHDVREFHADPVAIENMMSTLLNKKTLNNYESTLICKDGSRKQVLISSNAYTEGNEFIHTRCFTRDITKLKKAEKLLRYLNKASEELTVTLDTELALEKISGFIVPDFADWFIIEEKKSDGTTTIAKMAHAEPEKKKWAEQYRQLNPIDLDDARRGSIGWVIRTGEAVHVPCITPEMIDPDSNRAESIKLIQILSLASAMIIPLKSKGKVIGVVSFLSCTAGKNFDDADFSFAKDFTNRIALTLENSRLYEEVKKDIHMRIDADRRKDEFISIASHELKTPVTSLKAYTQILHMKLGEKDDPAVSKMLSKMNSQVDKLTGLIVDLLDITKIDKGEMIFDIEEIDFNNFVREIAEEIQRTSVTHTIRLKLKECSKVKGDKNRLAQVVTNYISNAIKYSPDEKEIIISTGCSEKGITLCVRDFGIGIPKQEQSKLFRRFYRVNGKNNQYTFPGLGLGLYICSEIIKRHKGTVSVKSNGAKGSAFCFTLPR